MLIYGNDPEGIVGLAARFGKLNGNYARQIVDAGGTGNALWSIYFVCWSPEEMTGIYPKNAPGGLRVVSQDNIHWTEPDQSDPNKKFLANVTDYSWFVGLKVRDHRYAARLCNIPSDIDNDVLFEKFIITKNRIIKKNRLHAYAYMSPDLYTRFEVAAFNRFNTQLTYKEDLERDTAIVSFAGIRIKENDVQLHTLEKQVV